MTERGKFICEGRPEETKWVNIQFKVSQNVKITRFLQRTHNIERRQGSCSNWTMRNTMKTLNVALCDGSNLPIK